jgi:hypothetical protein
MPSREFHAETNVKRAQHGKILQRGPSARLPGNSVDALGAAKRERDKLFVVFAQRPAG